jgi:hypothetical protein
VLIYEAVLDVLEAPNITLDRAGRSRCSHPARDRGRSPHRTDKALTVSGHNRRQCRSAAKVERGAVFERDIGGAPLEAFTQGLHEFGGALDTRQRRSGEATSSARSSSSGAGIRIPASAQPPGGAAIPAIGVLAGGPSVTPAVNSAFERSLRDLGWNPGQTIRIEYR